MVTPKAPDSPDSAMSLSPLTGRKQAPADSRIPMPSPAGTTSGSLETMYSQVRKGDPTDPKGDPTDPVRTVAARVFLPQNPNPSVANSTGATPSKNHFDNQLKPALRAYTAKDQKEGRITANPAYEDVPPPPSRSLKPGGPEIPK